ncbi:TldD/PmbA family protein [Methylibium rhizosphaerae]|uniref:TldD/PmbA family protein n=1 Tax=Methylibium rhizosphaerae TaxID=2570323 RepID=UPI0015E39B56|nr:TldD/PmbA family protein [Methylibium rhizosphaerae]
MTYTETRHHELRRTRLQMVDGNLVLNQRQSEGGLSCRVYHNGYWGFASAPRGDAAALQQQAHLNAQAMARFGTRGAHALPGGGYRGEHRFQGKPPISTGQAAEQLAALHAYCKRRYPTLKSTRFLLREEEHAKQLATSEGGESLSAIRRATCHLFMVGEDAQGAPVEIDEPLSVKGGLGDLDLSVEALAPVLEQLHEHVQAKRHAVPAEGGLHTVVMAPALAGILAHEAMGHPCEADIVLGGAMTADLLGQRVGSELVTMIDYAHSVDGQEAMVPVYVDDEGTPARDAVLIERGILKGYMSSRETAARLGIEPSGNARAFGPHDEPLVRMRNTAILPGRDRYEDMIAGVDSGYLLLKTTNGQADSTTEFMFGITLAYEIRNGRVGRAIRDTTVSGSAIKVLQSVDAVSDQMHWTCAGYCGKKQTMIVSMGGPALRARAHLGGQ